MKKQHLFAVLTAGIMTLSACSAGGTDNASDSANSGAGSDAEANAGDNGSSSTSTDPDETQVAYVSPIGEFLGWDQGVDFDREAAAATFAQQKRDLQEAIASCMATEGFEYFPVDTSAQVTPVGAEDEPAFGTEEWGATYGFGISTRMFSQDRVGPDLVGYPYDLFGLDQPENPNDAYLDSLGESERAAYDIALLGSQLGGPPPVWVEEGREPTETELENYTNAAGADGQIGCELEANDEIFGGGNQGAIDAFNEEFGSWWVDLSERMDGHPEVIAYRSEVRSCVENRGLDYLTEADAPAFFRGELEAAGLGLTLVDPLIDVDTSDFTNEDFERAYREAESQPLPADKLAALATIQEIEINTVAAISECGGGVQGEEAALGSIRIELEQQYLADNSAQLAQYEGVFGS